MFYKLSILLATCYYKVKFFHCFNGVRPPLGPFAQNLVAPAWCLHNIYISFLIIFCGFVAEIPIFPEKTAPARSKSCCICTRLVRLWIEKTLFTGILLFQQATVHDALRQIHVFLCHLAFSDVAQGFSPANTEHPQPKTHTLGPLLLQG